MAGVTARRWVRGLPLLGLACAAAAPTMANDTLFSRPTIGFTGVPGIVDMPTAHAMQDADLSLSLGSYGDATRLTAHFQITPRLSGVFRYVHLDGYQYEGVDYYDRSFDLRYLLAEETRIRPAVTVGLQDFGGTGIYSGEYVVAAKTFGPLRATAGIGWGRFGSHNGFGNPLGLGARPDQTGGIQQTGRLDPDHWFRGDAALFGGLEYAVNDRFRLALEYSSDAYEGEARNMGFDHNSPVNIGASYRFRNGLNLSAAYLYGSTAALQLSYTFNPKAPTARPPVTDSAPPIVTPRAGPSAADLGWVNQPGAAGTQRDRVETVLAALGFPLDGFAIRADRVLVQFRNPGNVSPPQAVGRIARALTSLMPASVERFEIVPVSPNGVPASRVILSRSDLEQLEHAPDGAWQIFARTRIQDTPGTGLAYELPGDTAPAFTWGIGPYVSASYFDPDSPVRLDFGVEARARYELTHGLVLSGRLRHRLSGNRADLRLSESVLPHVRSDAGLYARDGQTALTDLTLAKYFRAGTNGYGRVTAGYLESMYAGISGEYLWKPVDSRLALGVELNYVRQRAFDQGFGLRDYDVFTGHASAYFKGKHGFHYQLDMGRYLAGDWGATLGIDREFDNGIRIGAFATLTDVPFDDFGEGSFDKGLRFEIPLSALTGRSSARKVSRTLRPVQRDGGARLNVNGRLYESIREYHEPELQSEWPRFWR